MRFFETDCVKECHAIVTFSKSNCHFYVIKMISWLEMPANELARIFLRKFDGPCPAAQLALATAILLESILWKKSTGFFYGQPLRFGD